MRKAQKLAPRFSAGKVWLLAALLIGIALLATAPTSANHPVLVEGNCDSPSPGTTIVSPGTCGDYDGDGRIGTAEDTDGADRVFGTLGAALGPGTGAAAGTGANQNGRIVIVKSGRFSEPVSGVHNASVVIQSNAHVQIEAAPGVDANIDAVFQGDPASLNNVRQEAIGVVVSLGPGATAILRNLTIRNFMIGLRQGGAGRLLIEDCRFDNNRDFGIQSLNESRLIVRRTRVTATGRRVGSGNNNTTFGHGIQFADLAAGWLIDSLVINSVGAGVQNNSLRDTSIFETILTDNDGGNAQGRPLVRATP